jgi:glycosyltransferase involved in cell wall biosynthesis
MTQTIAVTAPRTSIIIRNFNRAHCLRRAIDSALAQTDSDFEILLVDDASTDDSVALAERAYVDRRETVRIIALPINSGAGAAANAGIAAARGHYVGFLDSDDEWLPEFLATQIAALEEAPAAALSFCDYVEIWEPYDMQRVMFCDLPEDQRKGMLLGGFIHSMTLTLMRRAAFEFVPEFAPHYSVSHDFDLWLALSLALDNPFVHVPQPLARHYRSADGVTTQHDKWLAEYRAALSHGYRHPRAQFYADLQAQALQNITIGIVARQQTGEWLERTSGALISVIVTTGGDLGALKRTLASIESQSHEHFEILVADAGTDPQSSTWLAHGDIEHWRHVTVGALSGRGASINLAAASAHGDLLAFIDEADVWHPSYLLEQARAHSYVSGSALYSVTDFEIADVNDQKRRCPGTTLPKTSDWPYHALRDPPMTLSNFVCRRDRFLAVGGCNDAMLVGEALDLTLKLLRITESDDQQLAYLRHPPVRVPHNRVSLRIGARDSDRDALERDWETTAGIILAQHLDTAGGYLRLLHKPLLAHLRGAFSRHCHFTEN